MNFGGHLEKPSGSKPLKIQTNKGVMENPASKIFLFAKGLTLSSIYTHFNTLKEKALGKHCGKR